jgi:hypothetical protein
MKLTPLQVEAMRERIAPLDTEDLREAYRSGLFPRAESCQDVNVRYRWDLFWAAGGYRLLPDDRSDINSDHIDTGLRRIVPPLTRAAD